MAATAGSSIYDITRFGAVGDGQTKCTEAIQAAIDAAAAAGGGLALVPPGRFLTGTLYLRSCVTLEIQTGGVLLASGDLADYPEMTHGHNKDRQPYHFIVAEGIHDFAIRGGGTIDGNGPAFWHEPEGPRRWIKENKQRPSPMLEITRCQDVRLSDITLTNSPGWTCHLHDCDRVFCRGVRIDNNLFGPNTDGFDITGCYDVMVSDCYISTGDDAIVLKTTPESRDIRRVTVTNCVIRTNCVALKLGASESFHNMRQVTFSNCVVFESTRAFGLYATRGGWYEDIAVSNVVCDTRTGFILNRPIHIDTRCWDDQAKPGGIRNVSISNFIARTDGRILITAADGCAIENLTMRDVRLSYPWVDDPRPTAPTAGSSQFSNHSPEARAACAAVVVDGVRNLVVENLAIDWPSPGDPIPDEWQFEELVQNSRQPAVDAQAVEPPPFHALWLRKVQGGYIHAPLAQANQKGVERVAMADTQIDLR